jgi:hypothetical protein
MLKKAKRKATKAVYSYDSYDSYDDRYRRLLLVNREMDHYPGLGDIPDLPTG